MNWKRRKPLTKRGRAAAITTTTSTAVRRKDRPGAGGAVLGGFLVGVVENLVGTYVKFIGTELKLTVALAIIIIVLLVRPSGLFGRAVVRRV